MFEQVLPFVTTSFLDRKLQQTKEKKKKKREKRKTDKKNREGGGIGKVWRIFFFGVDSFTQTNGAIWWQNSPGENSFRCGGENSVGDSAFYILHQYPTHQQIRTCKKKKKGKLQNWKLTLHGEGSIAFADKKQISGGFPFFQCFVRCG